MKRQSLHPRKQSA